MVNNRGKKFDQKMKPFLVYEYLMRNSDENNIVKAERAEVFLDLGSLPLRARQIKIIRGKRLSAIGNSHPGIRLWRRFFRLAAYKRA